MVHKVNDNNLLEYVRNYDRVIWFFNRKGQENTGLSIKPFGYGGVNDELFEEFKSVTVFETTIDDNPKIVEYFNLNDKLLWSHKIKTFNPRIILLKDGKKIYDQSGKKCYCLDTMIEMIFDLYPELIPVPSSE